MCIKHINTRQHILSALFRVSLGVNNFNFLNLIFFNSSDFVFLTYCGGVCGLLRLVGACPAYMSDFRPVNSTRAGLPGFLLLITSLLISNNSSRRLSNSLLWIGYKDRVEVLWDSAIWWVSRRIAMISASLMSLGLVSLNRRRISGPGRASMKRSRAKVFNLPWSVVGYSCLVNFMTDWAYSEIDSLFPITLVLSWLRKSSALSTNPKRRFNMST